MSWSYRSDRSDEIYAQEGGPTITSGEKQANTPSSAPTQQKVYTADGAIEVRNHTAVISKTSAAAMTLAAPTRDGQIITVTAGTAFAHVVTATGLLDDGVTGGAKNTCTLGAFVGATATFRSYNGHWVLQSKTVATIA